MGHVRLDLATWPEVEAYLGASNGIIIPAGSTEQHGPMGLIGTDAICAERVATGAADLAGAMVAPTLAYAPAPFNMAFPGTISLSGKLFEQLAAEILGSLAEHGFDRFYFVNGHGANLAPLGRVAAAFRGGRGKRIRVKSWVGLRGGERASPGVLRRLGRHARDPVGVWRSRRRAGGSSRPAMPLRPPEKLPPGYIERHAGDRHGPPGEHRRRFPDGRVGSHSALATPEHGAALLEAAAAAVAEDYARFVRGGRTGTRLIPPGDLARGLPAAPGGRPSGPAPPGATPRGRGA